MSHVILVSKSFFFSFFGGLLFNLGACWDKSLDSDFDQCLTIRLQHEAVEDVVLNKENYREYFKERGRKWGNVGPLFVYIWNQL